MLRISVKIAATEVPVAAAPEEFSSLLSAIAYLRYQYMIAWTLYPPLRRLSFFQSRPDSTDVLPRHLDI
jgi:hypothetical protein